MSPISTLYESVGPSGGGTGAKLSCLRHGDVQFRVAGDRDSPTVPSSVPRVYVPWFSDRFLVGFDIQAWFYVSTIFQVFGKGVGWDSVSRGVLCSRSTMSPSDGLCDFLGRALMGTVSQAELYARAQPCRRRLDCASSIGV